MARRRRSKGAVRAVGGVLWGYALKPTGVGFWRYLIAPGATRTGRAGKWVWTVVVDPKFRAQTTGRLDDRIIGRRGGWTRTPTRERRRPKKLGRYHCRRCGWTVTGLNLKATEHPCVAKSPTQPRHPGYHDKPTAPRKKARAATGSAKPPPPPRRRVRPLPPVANPTKGARIVRAGTAAERLAFLATVEIETTEEFEAMVHNLRMGILRLSQEIYDLAENTDVDRKVKEKIDKLAEETAELAEPARDIRTTFRRVYKDYLAAKEAGIEAPFRRSA